MNRASGIAGLRSAFGDTPLQAAELLEIPLEGSHDCVFAYDIAGLDPFTAWTCARRRCDLTGRWPVLALGTGSAGSWAQVLRAKQLFSRFSFTRERRDARSGDTPADIIAAAQALNVAEALSRIPDDDSIGLDELLEVELENTRCQFGKAPPVDDARAFLQRESINDAYALERWLFEWEIRNCENPLRLPEHGLAHLKWYSLSSERPALLLFPSLHGWGIPAYLSWFGATRRNSQLVVALLRRWHASYGAELVAHYGTMLQLVATRRPATAEQALELAWQHYRIAPCTTLLPGVSVRDHARALLHTDRWFLHERP